MLNGPTRRSKKFSDMFSRFDTIPAVPVTIPVPASQPPSHVAVGITLSAKASGIKIARRHGDIDSNS